MKKVLGYLVMVCCFSVARGQDDEPGAQTHSIERVIKILKQKGITVVVDKRNLKLAEPVRVPIQPFSDSLLPRIFADQPYLKYEFIANRLAISKKTKEEIDSTRYRYAYNIRGVVLSDSSFALPAASIQLRSGRGGTMTSSFGDFTLEWSIGDTLEISYISYKTIYYSLAKQPQGAHHSHAAGESQYGPGYREGLFFQRKKQHRRCCPGKT